jgi:NADPH-dependent glutamate synthase beta subunit-like oxidoreductase
MPKPFAITLNPGSSLANHTGFWRVNRPVYVDHLPPCNNACPAGENIQGWLYEADAGNYEAAWRLLVETNPLPAIMGRVCYHPCETNCNRGRLDQPVNIHAVERFLGDEALRLGWKLEVKAESVGKRVLVVGAGPSGLCAAYHLARIGYQATIYEAGLAAGGMMRFGIPRYRLPRNVLDAEIARIQAMGVEIVLNRKVDDLALTMAEGGFDAAFLAVGAHVARRVSIPALDARRILDAVSVLRGMESENLPQLGRRVIVYGGGNTAIDVARTARRLGATDTLLIYRRTRDKMSAHDFEVREALEEGVQMKWLSTIREAGEKTFTVEKDAAG